ncbi:MAG: hypothetical protein WBQ43_01990 [Terriglobales bacterium]
MTRQMLKAFAASSALLGLLLSAPLCGAQGRLATHPHKRNSLSASSSASRTIQSAQPDGASYTYTLFDFPATFYTFGIGMNVGATTPKIEIVGGYGDAPLLGYDSFLMYASQGKKVATESYKSVAFPKVHEQSAFGVNDSGQMVGEYLDASGVYHGWELSAGKFTTIDVPFAGATGTGTNGINDSGEIAGGWNGSGISQHGFTLIGGTYTSFDYPGAIETYAWSLNNNGDIVGYWVDTSGELHGFVLSGGTYTSLDPPGSVWTVPTGIDDAGDVVGGYCTTSECLENLDGVQGFLWSGGVFTTFTIPGATGTALAAINDKGVILGGYYDVAGFEHGFLAVP